MAGERCGQCRCRDEHVRCFVAELDAADRIRAIRSLLLCCQAADNVLVVHGVVTTQVIPKSNWLAICSEAFVATTNVRYRCRQRHRCGRVGVVVPARHLSCRAWSRQSMNDPRHARCVSIPGSEGLASGWGKPLKWLLPLVDAGSHFVSMAASCSMVNGLVR